MLSRLILAIPFIPLLLFIFLKGEISFLIMVEIISIIGMYEFYKMISKKYNIPSKLSIVIGSFIPILTYFRYDINKLLYFLNITNTATLKFEIGTFIFIAFFILALDQIIINNTKNPILNISISLFGIIYIPYLLSHLILLHDMPYGNLIIVYSFLSIWACDSGAYFTGLLLGRKIFPFGLSKISPKKSIEGSIGGIISIYILTNYFSEIIQFISFILGKLNIHITKHIDIFYVSNTKLWILALLIFIFATIGDLVESMFKREFNVKDSSNILLGHGGFLDRFDSTLFVIPLVYYFIKFFIL